jgi:hypothetical protein
MISPLSCDLVPVTRSAPTRAELEAAFAEFLCLDVAAGDASAATVRS